MTQLDGRAASVFLGVVNFSLSDQLHQEQVKKKKDEKSIALTGGLKPEA